MYQNIMSVEGWRNEEVVNLSAVQDVAYKVRMIMCFLDYLLKVLYHSLHFPF